MSDKQLAVRESATQWDDRVMVDTLKQTVCKGATDAQFRMFIEVCKNTGLNPFLKEIYFVPQVGVMAGRDGYLRKANDDPNFDGMETRVERDERNIPIKAVCTVWRKDRSHPIVCEAYYNEYKKGSQVWNQYPSAMIAKVAEVLALKRSFAINGVVTEEEIGEQGSKEAQQEVLKRKLAEIPPAGPAVDPAVIVELADQLDTPAPPKKRKGTVPFDGLKSLREVKAMLHKQTGNDAIYYDALKAAGVEHANELDAEPARAVWKALWKALATVHKRLLVRIKTI